MLYSLFTIWFSSYGICYHNVRLLQTPPPSWIQAHSPRRSGRAEDWEVNKHNLPAHSTQQCKVKEIQCFGRQSKPFLTKCVLLVCNIHLFFRNIERWKRKAWLPSGCFSPSLRSTIQNTKYTFLLLEELFSVLSDFIISAFSLFEDLDLFLSFSLECGESDGLSLLLCLEEAPRTIVWWKVYFSNLNKLGIGNIGNELHVQCI